LLKGDLIMPNGKYAKRLKVLLARDKHFQSVLNRAIEETFAALMEIKIETKDGFIYNEGDFIEEVALAANVGVFTLEFSGNIILAFPKATFLGFCTKLGNDVSHDEIKPELIDTALEILNIALGIAKTRLNEDERFEMASTIPTALVGKDLSCFTQNSEPIFVVPYESEFGRFFSFSVFGLNDD